VQSSREHELQQQLDEVTAQLTEARTHADATVTGAHGELTRTRADADRRQRSLQWDVEQMHAKLADAERRNQELADGVANGESAGTCVVSMSENNLQPHNH
jgi:chromosome segregation ATPase